MSMERLVSEYIESAERVFREIKIAETPTCFESDAVVKVIDSAKDYLKDAEYYREKQKFGVSLTCVAYCEGLLDALRLLGAVKFEWSSKRKRAKSGK